MTYGAILTCSLITVFVILIMIFACWTSCSDGKSKWIIGILICFIVCGLMWGITAWYYNSTEQGKRAFKTQESNFNGGIVREVKVYDVEG